MIIIHYSMYIIYIQLPLRRGVRVDEVSIKGVHCYDREKEVYGK